MFVRRRAKPRPPPICSSRARRRAPTASCFLVNIDAVKKGRHRGAGLWRRHERAASRRLNHFARSRCTAFRVERKGVILVGPPPTVPTCSTGVAAGPGRFDRRASVFPTVSRRPKGREGILSVPHPPRSPGWRRCGASRCLAEGPSAGLGSPVRIWPNLVKRRPLNAARLQPRKVRGAHAHDFEFAKDNVANGIRAPPPPQAASNDHPPTSENGGRRFTKAGHAPAHGLLLPATPIPSTQVTIIPRGKMAPPGSPTAPCPAREAQLLRRD